VGRARHVGRGRENPHKSGTGWLVSALNDAALVRREYMDETGLSQRIAAQQSATGPDPRQVAFDAVAEVSPRRVLEVGPGRGEFAEWIQRELATEVVAVDQSPRMVELTRARGVEAILGDVQDLPFAPGQFDAVLAAWMLYHVPDLNRALRELRRVLRPDGRLIAVTNSAWTMPELWGLITDEPFPSPFSAENGEGALLQHFTIVERRDVQGTVTFPDWTAARNYVAASPSRGVRADRLPHFDGQLQASRHVVVFVCEP
jgi:SAM-dependent methyltransferase